MDGERRPVEIRASIADRTLAVEMTMGGNTAPSAIICHPTHQEVTCETADGRRVALRRHLDRSVPDHPTRLRPPIRVSYRVAVPGRMLLLADEGQLAAPAGRYEVTSVRADADEGGIVWVPASGPGDLPSMVVWPAADAPRLHLTINEGRVRPEEGYVARELQLATSYLTSMLGPIRETTVVSLTEPNACARSRPGLITVHDRLLEYPGTLVAQFLPHELSHQWFGNRIRFLGEGFLWGQECLPEAIQHLYLRARSGAALADRIGARYAVPNHGRLLDQLFTTDPTVATDLSSDKYHQLLAAGTQLWLTIAERLGAGFAAVLRDLAAGNEQLTIADLARHLRSAGGPAVDSLLPTTARRML